MLRVEIGLVLTRADVGRNASQGVMVQRRGGCICGAGLCSVVASHGCVLCVPLKLFLAVVSRSTVASNAIEVTNYGAESFGFEPGLYFPLIVFKQYATAFKVQYFRQIGSVADARVSLNTPHLEPSFQDIKGAYWHMTYVSSEVLTKEHISAPMSDLRRALLEADVSPPVVRRFVQAVSVEAVDTGVIRGVRPDQRLVKIFSDELVKLMGGEKLEHLKKMLSVLCVAVCNSGTGVLNDGIGADYVQKAKIVLHGFGPSDAGIRCASFDEDADRLVYFLVPSNYRKMDLVDGDKILSLFALFTNEQLHIIQNEEGIAGGWVVYFSYDTVRYVETKKIPFSSTPRDDRNFADIHLGLYADVVIFDHVEFYCLKQLSLVLYLFLVLFALKWRTSIATPVSFFDHIVR